MKKKDEQIVCELNVENVVVYKVVQDLSEISKRRIKNDLMKDLSKEQHQNMDR